MTRLRLRLALAVALAAGCEPGPPPEPRNVVLVVVDTLRADHLSLYGYARDTSPVLDRLARRATVFEQAQSQAACTVPSVNSLLTSMPPSRAANRFDMAISTKLVTLAELCRARGLTTFASSASPIVRATPSRMNRVGGFGRGFDRFAEHCSEAPAACVTASFEEFLGTARPPFFAFLFYFDPHAPYQPPAEHPRRFALHLPAIDWVRDGNPKPIEWAIRHERPIPVPPADVQALVDLYDEEIAYLDEQIGQVFAALDARGVLDETLVILAADHGEMFLEHGQIGHCREVYDSVVRTPLVLWGPGGSGRRVRAPVANLDIVPTILDYLRVPLPPGLAGRSLRPLVEGAEALASRAAVCASMGTLAAASDGRFKLVRDVANGAERLYDRTTDPGETSDRRAELTGERARLAAVLDAWIAVEQAGTPARAAEDAKQFEQRLRDLGYLQ